jgi:N utilization substance protein B
MTRREIREHLFQILFRADFYDEEGYKEQEEIFFEELAPLDPKDDAYMKEKLGNVVEKIPTLDAALNERTTHWKTSRMGKVELTILRLALYEIMFDEDIPQNVAVNEAVELVKKYGTEESSSFVNGVLANFL